MSYNQTNDKDSDQLLFNDIKFDDAAFEAFFKSNFTSLCAYCQYKFGFDTDGAKEVVHAGFIKLWEVRQTVSPELPVKAYLYKVITNNSLDILKHEKVKRKHEQHVLQSVPATSFKNDFEGAGLKQLEADVNNAISELPEQMRKIFELSRYEELKYAEIASLLNISVKTVETQMGRALTKLRQKLAGYLTVLFILVVCLFIKK